MAIDRPPDSKIPEEAESGTTDYESRLKAWLDSLPPGGTCSVLLPGDDGYEEAKAAVEETKRQSGSPET